MMFSCFRKRQPVPTAEMVNPIVIKNYDADISALRAEISELRAAMKNRDASRLTGLSDKMNQFEGDNTNKNQTPSYAVFCCIPMIGMNLEIKREDIHKYRELNLCQFTSSSKISNSSVGCMSSIPSVLNLTDCVFDKVYVANQSFSFLYMYPHTNVTINELVMVYNIHAEGAYVNKLYAPVETITSNRHVDTYYDNIKINKITMLFLTYTPRHLISHDMFKCVIELARKKTPEIQIELKINSFEAMKKNVDVMFRPFHLHNKDDYTKPFDVTPLVEICQKNNITLTTNCDIPYDIAKNVMRGVPLCM